MRSTCIILTVITAVGFALSALAAPLPQLPAVPETMVGLWKLRDAPDGKGLTLLLGADGSGKIGDAAMHFSVAGNRLNVTIGPDIIGYTFLMDDGTLIVSGGDLDAPTAFVRKGATRTGIGGHLPAGPPGTQPAMGQPLTDASLLGKWQSGDGAIFEFRADGTLTFNGKTTPYTTANNMLSIQAPDGRIDAPFMVMGQMLKLSVNGQTQNLSRMVDLPAAPPRESVAIPAGHVTSAAPVENNAPMPLPGGPAINKASPLGLWQEASGELVRFSGDGTMQIGDKLYRYTANNGQLLISVEGGTVTWPFDLNGDRLTLSVTGQAQVLTRVVAPPQNVVPAGQALKQMPPPQKAER